MAAFMPGASPPVVATPIFFKLNRLQNLFLKRLVFTDVRDKLELSPKAIKELSRCKLICHAKEMNNLESTKLYSLPKLPYDYKDLTPHMSEEQLRIHHSKHHQAYVNGGNGLLERLDKARKENAEIDIKATLKELSWNIGGHVLHSLFWGNLTPAGKGGGGKPASPLSDALSREFGSFERFKKEFTQAASGVEGSGWAALSLDRLTGRPLVMQIEKHNTNVYPTFKILMVLDVFEHAYYIDYKNDRAKFIETFWNIVNWNEVNQRFQQALK
jgi:Fe-Mn family superoxide dismutase